MMKSNNKTLDIIKQIRKLIISRIENEKNEKTIDILLEKLNNVDNAIHLIITKKIKDEENTRRR